jgi:glucose-1-phosphate cytidylyltransferase
MKVVLFCGGLGMRVREYSDSVPKPMIPIGSRPILWHVMKYYAHFGHKDFILCLGYGADVIKNYFLGYSECLSNDFVLSHGGKELALLNTDIQDWRITFADTGTTSSIGQRLKAVEKYLGDDEVFLANYSDGLTNLPLPDQIAHFYERDRIASFLCVKPNLSYHFIGLGENGVVRHIRDVSQSDLRINGGYFIFKRAVLSYLRRGEDLLSEPFQRLLARQQLLAYNYDGFWACMDTFKDKRQLDELCSAGRAPWELWKHPGGGAGEQDALSELHVSEGRFSSAPLASSRRSLS